MSYLLYFNKYLYKETKQKNTKLKYYEVQKMKILSLFVALMFVMSLMPLALATDAQERMTASEDCLARMEKEFPNIVKERLEEKCAQLRVIERNVIGEKDFAGEKYVVGEKDIVAAKERLQERLEKISEDKEKILEGLSEEQKEKLASLDRARITEYTKKNSDEMKKALDNIRVTQVKKEDAFKKRVIAQNKVENAKENYERAKNNYEEAKEDYIDAKKSWEKAVKSKKDDDAIRYGKVYLVGASEMVIASLEKVKSQIESNDDLTEEEATEALTEINAKIAEMEEAKEQVMNAKTKEEVKESARLIQQAWERTRLRLAVHAEKQVQTSVGEILSRSTALEQHLERILTQMEEDGVNGTEEIDAKVEEFSEKIADARETFAESQNKFDEAKETNDKELLDESKELSREAHQLLGEAQKILVEIVREVKADGYDIEDDNEYVEIIEEDNDDVDEEDEEEDETETENEEESEDDEPVACCMAMTADCLACSAGLDVDDYCESNPETIGCEDYTNESGNNETEHNESEEEGD